MKKIYTQRKGFSWHNVDYFPPFSCFPKEINFPGNVVKNVSPPTVVVEELVSWRCARRGGKAWRESQNTFPPWKVAASLSSLRTEHFIPPWKITFLLLPCKVMKTISSIFSLLSSAGCATHSSPLPRTADFCRVDELRFYKRKLRGDNVVLLEKNRERHRVFLSHFHAFPLSELSGSSESEWKVGSFLCCFPKSSFIQFSSIAHQRKESVLIKRLFLRLRGVRSSVTAKFLFVICCFKWKF